MFYKALADLEAATIYNREKQPFGCQILQDIVAVIDAVGTAHGGAPPLAQGVR